MIKKILDKAIHKRIKKPIKVFTILISAIIVVQVFQGYYLLKSSTKQESNVIQVSPKITLPDNQILGARTEKNIDYQSEIKETVSQELFKDIPTDHPQFNATRYLLEAEIISSNQENLFYPDQELTRAEAITMLLKAAKIEIKDSYPNIFTDVFPEDWFFDQATTAHFLGLISPKEDGSFNAPGKVTQAEFLKILATAFDISTSKYDHKFAPWYQPYLDMGIDTGLITNPQPAHNLTRAQAAQIIFRELQ